mmetsp:Transcript_2808/g.6807  ORF Transcript_2808/g.6807 Transcript_2808/m.6807 type:complete len:209 (-) Transcript_2808:809-1435(-)
MRTSSLSCATDNMRTAVSLPHAAALPTCSDTPFASPLPVPMRSAAERSSVCCACACDVPARGRTSGADGGRDLLRAANSACCCGCAVTLLLPHACCGMRSMPTGADADANSDTPLGVPDPSAPVARPEPPLGVVTPLGVMPCCCAPEPPHGVTKLDPRGVDTVRGVSRGTQPKSRGVADLEPPSIERDSLRLVEAPPPCVNDPISLAE